MAQTHNNSDQFDRMYGEIPKAVDVHEHYARVRIMPFTYTQIGNGDAGSTLTIQRLPAGTVRLISVRAKALGGSSLDVTLGHGSYERVTGSNREIVPEAFAYGSSGEGPANINTPGGVEFNVFPSDNFQLTATFKSIHGVDLKFTTAGEIADGVQVAGYILFGLD